MALRVNSVEREEFERLVEGGATVSEIADRGKRAMAVKPLIDLKGRTPEEMQAGAHAFGHLSTLAEFAAKTAPRLCARGQLPPHRKEMRGHAVTIRDWLCQLIKECDR